MILASVATALHSHSAFRLFLPSWTYCKGAAKDKLKEVFFFSSLKEKAKRRSAPRLAPVPTALLPALAGSSFVDFSRGNMKAEPERDGRRTALMLFPCAAMEGRVEAALLLALLGSSFADPLK